MADRKARARETTDRSDQLSKWPVALVVARSIVIKESLIYVSLDDHLIEVSSRPGAPGQERVCEARKATPPERRESLKALLTQDFV